MNVAQFEGQESEISSRMKKNSKIKKKRETSGSHNLSVGKKGHPFGAQRCWSHPALGERNTAGIGTQPWGVLLCICLKRRFFFAFSQQSIWEATWGWIAKGDVGGGDVAGVQAEEREAVGPMAAYLRKQKTIHI